MHARELVAVPLGLKVYLSGRVAPSMCEALDLIPSTGVREKHLLRTLAHVTTSTKSKTFVEK
jgi:hypothetical protein